MSRLFKLAIIMAAAATLAACGQSPFRSSHSDLRSSTTRHAAIEQPRRPSATASVARRTPAPEAREGQDRPSGKSQGIASFYWQGTRTASGEKFDLHAGKVPFTEYEKIIRLGLAEAARALGLSPEFLHGLKDQATYSSLKVAAVEARAIVERRRKVLIEPLCEFALWSVAEELIAPSTTSSGWRDLSISLPAPVLATFARDDGGKQVVPVVVEARPEERGKTVVTYWTNPL